VGVAGVGRRLLAKKLATLTGLRPAAGPSRRAELLECRGGGPPLAPAGNSANTEPRRQQPRRERAAADGTKDWQLGKKSLDEQTVRDLIVAVSQITMSNAWRVKILSGIMIYRVELECGTPYEVEAKRRTGVYHDAQSEMSPQERRGSIPPFVLQVEASLDVSATRIEELGYDESHHIVAAFSRYGAILSRLTPADKCAKLLEDWRFCRYGTTWTKARSVVEIAISPIACPEAAAVLKAFIALLKIVHDAVQKHGVAPKNQLELRVESILKRAGVWKNRSSE
jgi:hypothetical protein